MTVSEIKDSPLDSMEGKKQRTSSNVRNLVHASLAHWQSNANIRPGIGYLHFFTKEESKTKEAIRCCTTQSLPSRREYGKKASWAETSNDDSSYYLSR